MWRLCLSLLNINKKYIDSYKCCGRSYYSGEARHELSARHKLWMEAQRESSLFIPESYQAPYWISHPYSWCFPSICFDKMSHVQWNFPQNHIFRESLPASTFHPRYWQTKYHERWISPKTSCFPRQTVSTVEMTLWVQHRVNICMQYPGYKICWL